MWIAAETVVFADSDERSDQRSEGCLLALTLGPCVVRMLHTIQIGQQRTIKTPPKRHSQTVPCVRMA